MSSKTSSELGYQQTPHITQGADDTSTAVPIRTHSSVRGSTTATIARR